VHRKRVVWALKGRARPDRRSPIFSAARWSWCRRVYKLDARHPHQQGGREGGRPPEGAGGTPDGGEKEAVEGGRGRLAGGRVVGGTAETGAVDGYDRCESMREVHLARAATEEGKGATTEVQEAQEADGRPG